MGDNVTPIRPEPTDAMGRWNNLALRQRNELDAMAVHAPDFSQPEPAQRSLLLSLCEGLAGGRDREAEVGG